MFEKCITCARIGVSCVPNLWLLPFPTLFQWCVKRQKHLGWSNQTLADNSNVPIGTINRLKAGDADSKYSTIRSLAIALIGGTCDEFSCNEQIDALQTEKLSVVEKENSELKALLAETDEKHRRDIRAIKEEYREQITFLKDELKAWRDWHQKHD